MQYDSETQTGVIPYVFRFVTGVLEFFYDNSPHTIVHMDASSPNPSVWTYSDPNGVGGGDNYYTIHLNLANIAADPGYGTLLQMVQAGAVIDLKFTGNYVLSCDATVDPGYYNIQQIRAQYTMDEHSGSSDPRCSDQFSCDTYGASMNALILENIVKQSLA